ncbi:MAG TPA: acyl carrier protein [Burkholderiaceae bacterium]|jgi:acyl carrier protein|nr:acyl carrier protein [Burkholderiaceae bacterium]
MTTLARLQTILIKNYPSLQREALTPDALLEELEIDSLGVTELFFSIEDEFKLSVPYENVDLKTIGDVVGYIDRLVTEQHGCNTPAGTAA